MNVRHQAQPATMAAKPVAAANGHKIVVPVSTIIIMIIDVATDAIFASFIQPGRSSSCSSMLSPADVRTRPRRRAYVSHYSPIKNVSSQVMHL